MSKIAVFEQSFSKPDNLWNIVKISQSGQSVGGQTEGNDCKYRNRSNCEENHIRLIFVSLIVRYHQHKKAIFRTDLGIA